MSASLMSLLHLCDSLFPIGAFSHSDGLEAATASGEVTNGDGVGAWMRALMDGTLRTCEAPAVARAWRACVEGREADLSALDAEVHALRPSAAARGASRAMGTRLLRTWQQIHPDLPSLARVTPVGTSWTFPVAFGLACAASRMPQRDAISGYLYTRLAATISAAMRLTALGQHEGHALLARRLEAVPALVDAVLLDDSPLSAFTPALDIAAMRHQYVHSRLFRS